MAHFWISDDAGSWGLSPIASGGCIVRSFFTGLVLRTLEPDQTAAMDDVLVVPSASTAGWALLTGKPGEVRVNGKPVLTGLRMLRDRDDLWIHGHRAFFSTEELAVVSEFPGTDREIYCPRCKQALVPGALGVSCPRCHGWHHQSEAFPCWTYDETCALCQQQPTALGAGYSWSPDEL